MIGKNGVGKTTLLKIIAKEEEAEDDIYYKKGIKIGYMSQIPSYNDEDTAYDIFAKGFEKIDNVHKKMLKMEEKMSRAKEKDLNNLLMKYSECQIEYELLGGYEVEEKISRVTIGLQMESLLQLPFSCLSGGEKTRVILGRMLLRDWDVLLLDEPTNHLDLKMLKWLEEYLREYSGALIIVSHDRYFFVAAHT